MKNLMIQGGIWQSLHGGGGGSPTPVSKNKRLGGLLTAPSVSAVTVSDPKNKAIIGWVNGHIISRMREVNDLLGSAAQGTQGNWV